MTRPAKLNRAQVPILGSPLGLGGVAPMPGVGDLSDLDLTGLSDGDIIFWDAGAGVWRVGPLSSFAIGPRAVEIIIDGGGATITTGIKGDVQVPFACTITAATLLADQTGSIVVDVWKDTYSAFPPVVGDSITASAKPTISSGVKSHDTTLTGWTTAIAADDILRFNVDSATTIQRVTVVLTVI